MSRIAYVNGRYVPRSEASVNVEDRGYQFADGVYEVTRYYGGKPFAMAPHITRLKQSLAQIRINEPPEVARLSAISDELLQRNNMTDAIVYWQITRGSSPRKPMRLSSAKSSPRPRGVNPAASSVNAVMIV